MFDVVDFHEMIQCFAGALEERDYYTEGHSLRVSDMVLFLAEKMGFSADEVQLFHFSAHLHDIGKIGIPDAILWKPGRLTDSEYAVIKEHPVIGARILNKSKSFSLIAKNVLHHHERFDGKGYPVGLSGTDIPIGARLIAVCDSIDAMLSNRSYRAAFPVEKCYEEIKNGAGNRYDPDVVDLVLLNWKELLCTAEYEC